MDSVGNVVPFEVPRIFIINLAGYRMILRDSVARFFTFFINLTQIDHILILCVFLFFEEIFFSKDKKNECEIYILCTGAFLYAPSSFSLFSNTFCFSWILDFSECIMFLNCTCAIKKYYASASVEL